MCMSHLPSCVGWDTDLCDGVWDAFPSGGVAELAHAILNIPLHKTIFCLLHAKVRIVGSMLKHLLHVAEVNKTVDKFKDKMRAIIKTFTVTLPGQRLKKSGKKATTSKVSALQGEQVDKILTCVRAAMKPEDSYHKTQWQQVLEACGSMTNSTLRLAEHKQLWEHMVTWYDIANSKTRVTDLELSTYKQTLESFGRGWVKLFLQHRVTPYVHIIVKHSYTYLKHYGTLRDWSQEGFEASHKRHKQLYTKTNFGGSKHGNESSAFLQVMQKLYRRQYLRKKLVGKQTKTEDHIEFYLALKKRNTMKSNNMRQQACRAKQLTIRNKIKKR